MKEPIYNTTPSPPNIEDFTLTFLDYGGLKPLRTADNMNLTQNISDYIEKHKKTHSKEIINPTVLKYVMLP